VRAPGRRLRAADLAVLAAVGCDPVPVFLRPRVSVLTTGDELVPPSETPGPGQIREGNTYYLRAAALAAGCELLGSGRVADDEDELRQAFGAALEEGDALITSGGVSVGKYDLVGKVLESLGVEPVLHKVAIKPGKPIWFGMRGDVPVFGLPGNPVSSMLGFEVFVRPALARLGGSSLDACTAPLRAGRWAGESIEPYWREQNVPCRIEQAGDGVDELHPLPWRGSADMVGVADADAFAVIPADASLSAGERASYRPLR
jgi:molybdopterin molybdotransferase